MCALTSSRLDDFSDIVNLYTVRITMFFLGKLGIFFEGEASTPQIPYIEPCSVPLTGAPNGSVP